VRAAMRPAFSSIPVVATTEKGNPDNSAIMNYWARPHSLRDSMHPQYLGSVCALRSRHSPDVVRQRAFRCVW
jgi:hypothetical protein